MFKLVDSSASGDFDAAKSEILRKHTGLDSDFESWASNRIELHSKDLFDHFKNKHWLVVREILDNAPKFLRGCKDESLITAIMTDLHSTLDEMEANHLDYAEKLQADIEQIFSTYGNFDRSFSAIDK